MKNQKHLNRLQLAGWTVKNIDGKGNVRFWNSHSVSFPNAHEPEFVWVENGNLKVVADSVAGEED